MFISHRKIKIFVYIFSYWDNLVHEIQWSSLSLSDDLNCP